MVCFCAGAGASTGGAGAGEGADGAAHERAPLRAARAQEVT